MSQPKSIFGPLLLIAAGAIWLLTKSGNIPTANLWALTYIWPYVLIAAGVGIILRSYWQYASILLDIVIIGGAVLSIAYAPQLGWDNPSITTVFSDGNFSIGPGKRGSGNIVTETRTVTAFNSISLDYPAQVLITQGEKESLKVEADDDFLPGLQTRVRGNTLEIFYKIENGRRINPTKSIKITIVVKELKDVNIGGAGDFMATRSRAWALVVAMILVAGPAQGAGHGEPGPLTTVRVDLRDRVPDLGILTDLGMDVDGVFGTWARVHALPEEIEKLRALGMTVQEMPEEPAASAAQYHTYTTLTEELTQIAQDHAAIARLYSIGKSVQGRDLWIMKITRNPASEEDEPEVRYIAAMHGDEVVGKEMCFELINLLTDSYGTDPRITSLVDTTEIWILPSMNPDGTEARRRYNANNFDLNRNFPDQFQSPSDTTTGRQAECCARWSGRCEARPAPLGASLRGSMPGLTFPHVGNTILDRLGAPNPSNRVATLL